jgi:hypothetical protein
MLRKLSLVDYILILIGLVSASIGIRTMLEIPAVILPGWFLVILFGGILLLLSFGLGALLCSLTKSKIHILSATSIIVTIVCLGFYISEYRPTYTINVADNFIGEVKLFRSTLKNNRLSLNKYGVGYITDKTYRKGFRPVVIKNGRDITKECEGFVQGNVASAGFDGTSFGPFSYVGFTIGDNPADNIWTDLKNAIELKVIDTSIIMKK